MAHRRVAHGVAIGDARAGDRVARGVSGPGIRHQGAVDDRAHVRGVAGHLVDGGGVGLGDRHGICGVGNVSLLGKGVGAQRALGLDGLAARRVVGEHGLDAQLRVGNGGQAPFRRVGVMLGLGAVEVGFGQLSAAAIGVIHVIGGGSANS